MVYICEMGNIYEMSFMFEKGFICETCYCTFSTRLGRSDTRLYRQQDRVRSTELRHGPGF